MNLLEWLGMIGLAVVTGWAAARCLKLNSRSGAIWRRGGRACSIVKDWFRDRYVSETTPAYVQYARRRIPLCGAVSVQYHERRRDRDWLLFRRLSRHPSRSESRFRLAGCP
jgi:hypothetical protein